MVSEIQVQILVEHVYISHIANTYGISMHQAIHPSTMGKKKGR